MSREKEFSGSNINPAEAGIDETSIWSPEEAANALAQRPTTSEKNWRNKAKKWVGRGLLFLVAGGTIGLEYKEPEPVHQTSTLGSKSLEKRTEPQVNKKRDITKPKSTIKASAGAEADRLVKEAAEKTRLDAQAQAEAEAERQRQAEADRLAKEAAKKTRLDAQVQEETAKTKTARAEKKAEVTPFQSAEKEFGAAINDFYGELEKVGEKRSFKNYENFPNPFKGGEWSHKTDTYWAIPKAIKGEALATLKAVAKKCEDALKQARTVAKKEFKNKKAQEFLMKKNLSKAYEIDGFRYPEDTGEERSEYYVMKDYSKYAGEYLKK